MISELLTGTLDLIKKGLPYLRKVEDLPSREELMKNLEQYAVNTPFLYAIYEGGRFGRPNATARRQTAEPTVILAVITKSLRDSHGQAASQGPSGAYQVLDDLRNTLVGQVPAVGFGQFAIVSEGLGAIRGGIVCYLVQYRASCTIKPVP